MTKPKYEKPSAQTLDRTLAVSIGGCITGWTPGTCGLPGYNAGTCSPTGTNVGIPRDGGTDCAPTGPNAGWTCNFGDGARMNCSTGLNALDPGGKTSQ